MRVRATAPGFFDVNKNGHPIDIPVGREFDVPEGLKARWFEPVAVTKSAAPANPPAPTAPPASPAGAAPEPTGGKPAAPAKPAPTK